VTGTRKRIEDALERFAHAVTIWTGGTAAFACAVLVIVAWAASGPLFGFGDTWQLVINTGTTVITFLMVFLLNRGQNKNDLATQLKLDEIIAASKGASGNLINIEDLSERDLQRLRERFEKLKALGDRGTHTVDEIDDERDDR
jgi:low affinity Fe/Cu permease